MIKPRKRMKLYAGEGGLSLVDQSLALPAGTNNYAHYEAKARNLLRQKAWALHGEEYAVKALQARDSFVDLVMAGQAPAGPSAHLSEEELRQVVVQSMLCRAASASGSGSDTD